LIKTMTTQLIMHERIFTTLAKAKELRRHVEKLIHKAKRLNQEDHLYLKKNLRTKEAIKKIKEEIAPRFRKLPAGFTKVMSMGKRANDLAPVGMIELMGNEFQEVTRNRIEVDKEQYGIETFWQWEAKVLEQEVDYYEELLRDLKSKIDNDIFKTLGEENLEDVDSSIPKRMLTADQKKAKEIISQVEDKYVSQKEVLVRGYERAKTEESVHYKQKDYRKYERMFENYAYPLDAVRFTADDRANITAFIEESDQVAKV